MPIAIITGAGYGIGREITCNFLRHEINVIALSKTQKNLDELINFSEKIESNSLLRYHELDLRDYKKIKEISTNIATYCQSIDYLIVNAGVLYRKNEHRRIRGNDRCEYQRDFFYSKIYSSTDKQIRSYSNDMQF